MATPGESTSLAQDATELDSTSNIATVNVFIQSRLDYYEKQDYNDFVL